MVIGIGSTSAISTSKIMKITAIRKNRDENGNRAEFFGSNPHSSGDLFSRSSLIFFEQELKLNLFRSSLFLDFKLLVWYRITNILDNILVQSSRHQERRGKTPKSFSPLPQTRLILMFCLCVNKTLICMKYREYLRGPGTSVGIASDYGLDGPGSNLGGDETFRPVQTGPGAHPASCKMCTVSFPGVKCGRGVLLTTHPLLVPRS